MLTDLQPFLGRFHPLIVHLPIGFLLLIAAVELLSRTRRFAGAGLHRVMPVLLGLGAASTLAAIATGLMLASDGGYDEALVGRHQRWAFMLAFALGVACVAAWARARRAQGGTDDDVAPAPPAGVARLYPASLVVVLVLVAGTGHFGGALTHGDGYLTEHMPALPFFGAPPAEAPTGPVDLSATNVYETLVAPTFTARCVTCHGPSRQAGKLRLDSPESIHAGGESGAVLVPGRAVDSLLVKRVFLPVSDGKVMPPRGHQAPSHAEMSLLRWWIDQGASFDASLAEVDVTPDLEPAIADRTGPIDFTAPAILSVSVPAASPAAIEALRAIALKVEPLRAGSSLLMVEAPPAARAFDDGALATLEPLAEQIAWLDLGGTQVTDEGLTRVLPKLVNLWRLTLARTAVTDAGLAPLRSLQRLEAVNLYATSITDAGLRSLDSLPRLRAVYAWQTRVTPQGADALRQALPRVQVNLGDPATTVP